MVTGTATKVGKSELNEQVAGGSACTSLRVKKPRRTQQWQGEGG